MTLALICKIVFPANQHRKDTLVLRKVNSITIESSWQLLTDKASVTMPRNVSDFEKTNVRQVFRVGDAIQIWLGYDNENNLKKEFEGYITKVSANAPIELHCEDSMFLLKRHGVNYAMKSTSLQQLIKDIIPANVSQDVADFQISKKRFPNTTAAKILEDLQSHKIYSYFKAKTLVVGKIYSDDLDNISIFNFERNVIDHSLQYKLKDDILILIKATSTLPKGQKINASFGDKAGTQHQLSYYNIDTKEALIELCKLDYNKFKKDGYKGDLTVFGIPSLHHGYKVKLKSNLYPDRDGIYFIKAIKKQFNPTGYKQILTLDKRAE